MNRWEELAHNISHALDRTDTRDGRVTIEIPSKSYRLLMLTAAQINAAVINPEKRNEFQYLGITWRTIIND